VPVKKWHVIIGEKTLADAILDRIVHQSIRIELFGDSLRKKPKENTEELALNL
jgi:DNA replication protein DnaC